MLERVCALAFITLPLLRRFRRLVLLGTGFRVGVFRPELRASLRQAEGAPCKPLQGFKIGETETLRSTRLNQPSLLKLDQKGTQPVDAEREEVRHDPTVEGLHQHGGISPFLLVFTR